MVPKLRFNEFKKDWQQKKIGDVFTIFSGFTFKSTDATTSGCRWLKIADVGCQVMTPNTPSFLPSHFSTEYHRFLIREDDCVVALTRPILNGKLKVAIAGKEYDGSLLNQRVGKIITKNNIGFIFSLLQMESTVSKINDCIAGTDPPNLSTQDIKDMMVLIPTIEEQTKIADFLYSVEERITLLNKQHDLLCQYKKGMMQKVFNQEVRFNDDNGKPFPKWNTLQLKEVAIRVTRKNKENNNTILTISGRDGLVDQMTYFNKQIASKNVTGYYLIRKGEFAYNKSYSQGYPMGAIKMLSNYEKGVVSTLYICFKLNDEQSCDFYQHYFESGLQNRAIEKVAQEGARNHGLLNIGVNDFFDIELQVPSLAEQNKIARFLSAIEDKIAIKRAELDMLKKWKQGLLQQMLV
ncbi:MULTISPECIES: restriction endonuclease subunit S [Klebsiella]|nr:MULTISPECIES: restriction endonuclease subunit S [Klebsiella]ELI7105496.1 restriction endonuclease subunit S [Klebsiella pneumoniae]MCA7804445.1 restriction endonuclease subunit S [Escherichia coli]HBR1377859.1 restriction endonuclease subunit S [Klebsiella quasipneumoniae subsp. similipneumoniae]MBF7749120.1 restriction endonuclease subunit S [Klebsiella quasipneumoniae]MBF7775876.1 restriction endonuclease subunit S [Klebsiella quasipneumoniae]